MLFVFLHQLSSAFTATKVTVTCFAYLQFTDMIFRPCIINHTVFKTSQVAVEEKQGISRLEQVVEEISEAERAKELRREQKRLKKKAKRKEKCKCDSQSLTISTDIELKEEESTKDEEEEDGVCVNGNVEETEVINGHGDSCEDDEDDGDSGGSPCSCEDLTNCERRKWKRLGYRNGDCG